MEDRSNQVERLRNQNEFGMYGFPPREGLRDSQNTASPLKRPKDGLRKPFDLFSPDSRTLMGAFTGSREDSQGQAENLGTPLQKNRGDSIGASVGEVGFLSMFSLQRVTRSSPALLIFL